MTPTLKKILLLSMFISKKAFTAVLIYCIGLNFFACRPDNISKFELANPKMITEEDLKTIKPNNPKTLAEKERIRKTFIGQLARRYHTTNSSFITHKENRKLDIFIGRMIAKYFKENKWDHITVDSILEEAIFYSFAKVHFFEVKSLDLPSLYSKIMYSIYPSRKYFHRAVYVEDRIRYKTNTSFIKKELFYWCDAFDLNKGTLKYKYKIPLYETEKTPDDFEVEAYKQQRNSSTKNVHLIHTLENKFIYMNDPPDYNPDDYYEFE